MKNVIVNDINNIINVKDDKLHQLAMNLKCKNKEVLFTFY